MTSRSLRQFACDWEPIPMPDNIEIHPEAHVDTAFSFDLCLSELPCAVSLAKGSQVIDGTMLDVGPRGRVVLGECAMLNGCLLIADSEVVIGDYTMLSWSVVIMDSYRISRNLETRRDELRKLPFLPGRKPLSATPPKPVHIGSNVWIGFEACILPGISIGDGSIVGARSTVIENVPPYTVVAGNPARVVRHLKPVSEYRHE